MKEAPSAPYVCIVILTWNQREDTLACLASLQEITYGNYDVILVDNGSTDGSQEAIAAQFKHVTVLAQTSNLGCAGGRNAGAHCALERQADYILFLDNDTAVKPDFLNHLITTGESDDTIGVLGPEIRYYHERQRIWTAGAHVDLRTGLTHPMRHGERATDAVAAPYGADFVAGCALLAKRAVFEAIGLFDGDYFVYFEDTDWCVRATTANYRVMVVPNSVVWHKESQSLGGASSPGKIYYMTRNQLLFVAKRFPKRRRLPMLTRILLNETRTIILHSILPRYRGLRQQRDARVRGVIDFLRGCYGSRSMQR